MTIKSVEVQFGVILVFLLQVLHVHNDVIIVVRVLIRMFVHMLVTSIYVIYVHVRVVDFLVKGNNVHIRYCKMQG